MAGGWSAAVPGTRVKDVIPMVSDPAAAQEAIDLVIETRRQAGCLLSKLQLDRQKSERRCLEFGFQDPIKDLTGLSAIERAIVETKHAVHRMDELICELQGGAFHLNGNQSINGDGTRHDTLEGKKTALLEPVGSR